MTVSGLIVDTGMKTILDQDNMMEKIATVIWIIGQIQVDGLNVAQVILRITSIAYKRFVSKKSITRLTKQLNQVNLNK